MARITIDALPEFTGNLATASFVPVMYEGTTYKYSPLTKSVGLTGDQTIAGVKTFSSSPIVPAGDASGEAVNYGQVVKNTGDETIAGVKNFTSTPTVSGSAVIKANDTSSTPNAGKVMVWPSDLNTAVMSVPSGKLPGIIGSYYMKWIGDYLFIRFEVGSTPQTVISGETLFECTGLPTGFSKVVRMQVTVTTDTVRTTAHLDILINSNGSGGVIIYPNGDRPLSGGAIVNLNGIYGDATIRL